MGLVAGLELRARPELRLELRAVGGQKKVVYRIVGSREEEFA